jgi:4-diphosphocytidyl-2-C-methyl-D-erythritol kinase
MLVFPNAKINLGLQVINKRDDGFHNIATVFYPVNWCDALEVIENEGREEFLFSSTGLIIDGNPTDNLLYKTWELLRKNKPIPNIRVHLHKNIPMGAGLGGGSADAAFFIELLNSKFELHLSSAEKTAIANQLGSDCAFFLKNQPVLASGRGNEFKEIMVDLSSYFILLVHPGVHSNTREAYEGLVPKQPAVDLQDIISKPVEKWKDHLSNDFEKSIFIKYPQVKDLKDLLYANGALYASMSGSGSAVFGIFKEEPHLDFPHSHRAHLQKPHAIIL